MTEPKETKTDLTDEELEKVAGGAVTALPPGPPTRVACPPGPPDFVGKIDLTPPGPPVKQGTGSPRDP